MGDVAELRDGEAFVVPVDHDTVFCANVDPLLLGTPIEPPRSLVDRFLDVASYALASDVARRLADGTLVRLSPQTVEQLKGGLNFARDAQGYALGIMRGPGGNGIVSHARFLTTPVDPTTAAVLLMAMVVQRQLRSIEQALERIDRKVAALGKAQRVGVLAEILALGSPIRELRSKVDTGIALSAEDENRIGTLEHRARTLSGEARLWVEHLRPLADGERASLREQHSTLVRALGSEHVAFWVRAGIASDIALVQLRSLRCHRATYTDDPAWSQELHDMAATEARELGQRQFDLYELFDRYLRDRDIAHGLEELSFGHKREVQQRRRELLTVANVLRDGLLATSSLFGDATGEMRSVAEPLAQRDIEPPPLVDKLRNGAQEAAAVAGQSAGAVGRALGDGGAAAGRALGSGADAARSTAARAAEEARRRLWW